MHDRELNKPLFWIVLYSNLATALVVWVLCEKFFTASAWAFLAGLVAASCMALAFTLFLDFRLNRSADFVMQKLEKMKEGDFRVRFKEEPDEILPFGINLYLDRLAQNTRSEIGGIWKVSLGLTRQLSRLLVGLEAGEKQSRAVGERLQHFQNALQNTNDRLLPLVRNVEKFKVQVPRDIQALTPDWRIGSNRERGSPREPRPCAGISDSGGGTTSFDQRHEYRRL